jgi:lipopolysaccharide biosynthesis glycosyltransferase
MLHSVVEHGGGRVHVHYLHRPGFPKSVAELITAMVERTGGDISFWSIPDERIVGLARPGGHQTAETWYRIFLPELLPDVDRVLYLDGDVIATDSIEPLWELDLGPYWIGAVTNVFEPWFLHRIQDLGLPGPESYFNAGVVMLNLDAMRRDACTQALIDYAVANHDNLFWVDQDTLNVVLGKKRLELHPRWNCMNSVMHFDWAPEALGSEVVAEARDHPAIRHFEGPPVCKPWHYMCQMATRGAYFDHRRQTPWPRVEIEGITPRNVATRLAADIRARASRLSGRAR